MNSLLRIHALASNTIREAIRNKLLYTLLGFAIVMIGSGVLIATLSYVEVDEILQDVGFGAIRFFSAGIAIFVGIGLISGEVDRRTIFTILSKPVSRGEFLMGKFVESGGSIQPVIRSGTNWSTAAVRGTEPLTHQPIRCSSTPTRLRPARRLYRCAMLRSSELTVRQSRRPHCLKTSDWI